MKKLLNYILMVFLILFNIYLLYLLKQESTNKIVMSKENKVLRVNLGKAERNIDNYSKIINSIYKPSLINDFKGQIIVNKHDSCVNLSDLHNGKTLFFIYSEYTCSPCIEQEIEIINSLSDTFKNSQLIILTNYKDPILFKKFCQINTPKAPIYNGNKISLFDKDFLVPYYFVLDNNSIKDVHFPDKNTPQKTIDYIVSILGN